MARSLPPLPPLRAFEATVRLGSMTAAAAELGRTHGAVSRAVQGLEAAVRCRLVERGGPSLVPTAAGSELFTGVTLAFEALERSMHRIAPQARRTQLRLACGSTFSGRWLLPRLPRFYAAHPDLTLSLVMSRRSFHDAEEFDLATTWDRLGYPAPHGRHTHVLGDAWLGAVCRADRMPRLRDGGRAVETLLTAETMNEAVWERYGQQSGLNLRPSRELRFPHLHHCIEGALSGLGMALVEPRLVEEDLATGRLVAPFGWLRFPDGFVAVENPLASRAEVRRLIAWLRAELASIGDPTGSMPT